ncbi:hypothetical protein LUZ60_001847 [Juncus effusus]|nr:hypothetical protein LUZ60_001847 [Juncus effusus]
MAGLIEYVRYDRKNYNKAAGETQLHNADLNNMFFLENDSHSGKKMTVHFTELTPNVPGFIPRSKANKLPFSSSKFSEILDNFKITKDSSEADLMKQTINDCERPAINGEKKFCATSLESMVDFATSILEIHHIRPLSTNVNPQNAPKQEYTIIKTKITARNEPIVCHIEPYAYAVFFCHMIKSTKAYMVNLVGKDGDQAAAVAVCHEDTSSWNPKHLAFQLLKVHPGIVPVCHFLLQDAVTWTLAM